MKRRTFLSQAAASGMVAAVVPSLAGGSEGKPASGSEQNFARFRRIGRRNPSDHFRRRSRPMVSSS